MKKILPLLLAFFAAAVLSAADSVPLFNATLTVGKEHRFVLANATGKTSQFLRIGESFDGYSIKAYDAKSGVLDLERDGKITKVTLVADAAATNVPLATPATLADATAVLNAMNFEQMLDKTMAGVRKQQAAGMGQMMGKMMPPNADAETKEAIVAFQKKVMDEMMGGVTGENMKDDVAKIYSEVFTKEELRDLGAFYQSPVGKTFSDKQPDLAEKMNGLMMTRMMGAMPKVQQMMQDFGREMQAKKAAAQTPATPKQ
ncbi:MAG TPA: DUF2059 domain-containing protein [Opitutaceae bacterium]|nr:DUF2059 domain-containing protein [Opitutaceae bacterium]